MKKTILLIIILFSRTVFAQWAQITVPNNDKIESMQFFSAMSGIACSFAGVIRTSDGGMNWTSTTGVYGSRDIDFATQAIGYTAGISSMEIKKSTDSGATWSPLTALNSNSLWGVSAPDANTVYVCGTGGVVWVSTLGGASFVAHNINTNNIIVDIDFTSPSTGYALDEVAGIYKTIDGGLHWNLVYAATLTHFSDMYFLDANNGFACGSQGKVFKTTDGGDNWTLINTSSTAYLQYIHFLDINNGIVVGLGGAVLHTVNGGANWITESTGTTINLYSCALLTPTTAIIAGDSGLVMRNINLSTGINNISSENLLKVYPNPVSEKLYLEKFGKALNEEMFFQLFTIDGRLVRECSIKPADLFVDISGIASDEYIYTIFKDHSIIARGSIVIN